MKKLFKVAAVLCMLALIVSCTLEVNPEVTQKPTDNQQPNVPENNGTIILPEVSELSDTPAEDFILDKSGEGVIIKGYKGLGTDVRIPVSIDGKPVTSITTGAFKNNTTIKKLHIPATITEIGDGITEGCSSIEELKIYDNKPATRALEVKLPVFTSDGNCIIRVKDMELIIGCKNSIIPNGVRMIGPWSFRGVTGLKKLAIVDGITKISDFALSGCYDLEELWIGKDVNDIGYNAFSGTGKLRKVTVSPLNKVFWSKDNGVLTERQDKNNPEKKDTVLVAGCPSTVIPEGVTVIGRGCFQNQQTLKAMTIPSTVTTIESGAFISTGIEELIIPKSVKKIETGAFFGCSKVETVKVEKGNTEWKAENHCLIRVSDKYLFQGFKNCKVIPGTVDTIGYRSFMWIDLSKTDMIIENGVKTIEEGAFRQSYLKSCVIPDSIIEIGKDPFEGCPFEPKYPSTLDWKWYSNGKTVALKSYNGTEPNIVIPSMHDGLPVTGILDSAIQGDKVITVTIPESVTNITEGAFKYCKNLKDIILKGDNTSYEVITGCLRHKESKTVIAGTKNCILPSETIRIGNFAFKETAIDSLVIPNSVKEIGNSAYDCILTLKDPIDIPAGVEVVGANAFRGHATKNHYKLIVHFAKDNLPQGWDKLWNEGRTDNVTFKP